MISLSVPSYSPTARARPTALSVAQQRAQRDWELWVRDSRLATGDCFCRASGSPHLSHIGDVMRRTDRQQDAHTQPDKGSSRSALHTAHEGARSAATNPSAIPLATEGIRDLRLGTWAQTGISDLGLGIWPRPGIRDLGLGTRALTGVTRSAFLGA